LNSYEKYTFDTETTPYFAPKGKSKLEKIEEREESRNTGSLPTDDLMALLEMPKEENPYDLKFAALGEDLKEIKTFNSCYF
jgi:hypothetical protein